MSITALSVDWQLLGAPAVRPQRPSRRGLIHWPELQFSCVSCSGQVKEALLSSNFDGINMIWTSFWSSLPEPHRAELQAASLTDVVSGLDKAFYNAVVAELIPDVFQFISPVRTKQIRTFAKQVEGWMRHALEGYPPHFVAAKITAVGNFGQACIKVPLCVLR